MADTTPIYYISKVAGGSDKPSSPKAVAAPAAASRRLCLWIEGEARQKAAAHIIQAAQRRRFDRWIFVSLKEVIWAALQVPAQQLLQRLAPNDSKVLRDPAGLMPTVMMRLAGPGFPPRLLYKVVCSGAKAEDMAWRVPSRNNFRSSHPSNHWRRVACRAAPPAGLAPAKYVGATYPCCSSRPAAAYAPGAPSGRQCSGWHT